MGDILFADGRRYSREWLDTHEAEAQEVFRAHKHTYPLCLCQRDGVPMHIRELSRTGKLYLARMPMTGPMHRGDCPSYEPIHGKAEEQAREAGLIEELGDGRVVFKVDVGFNIREPAAVSSPPSPAELPQMVQNPQPRLGLLAMMQFLWEQAELHHWHPKMEGRRRYKQVYDRLTEAASRILVKGVPLRQRLYIPEPFYKEQANEIMMRRLEAISRLGRSSAGKRRRFLVMGQLRELEESSENVRLRFAQAGNDLSVVMPRSAWERMLKRWGVKVPEEDSDLGLWGMFLIEHFKGATLHSRAAAVMQTTAHYIPVFRPAEASLAYGLVDSRRRFIKMLAIDGRPSENGPAFLLTDVAEKPVPLYISNRELPAETAVDEWYWHTDRDDMWPPLPVPQSRRSH
ncbi:MAG: DUF1173 family protein [Gammaproteobacteria bacterium]|nr:MAG: DUF1173 family protein [Gammaproteobacteria bacterium]